MSSSRYRRQIKHTMKKIFWQRWKDCFGIRNNEINPENNTSFDSNIELR